MYWKAVAPVTLSEVKLAMLTRGVVEYEGSPYYIIAMSLQVPDAYHGHILVKPGEEYYTVTLHDMNARSVVTTTPDRLKLTGETLIEYRRRQNKGGGRV